MRASPRESSGEGLTVVVAFWSVFCVLVDAERTTVRVSGSVALTELEIHEARFQECRWSGDFESLAAVVGLC